MKKTKVVLLVLSILICSSFALADTINVPADQPTIQAGINIAVDGDVVLVQPGYYAENINFDGKAITVGSLFYTTQDTSYISQTTIGQYDGSAVTFENTEDSTAVLTGFTISFGYASSGGGIYCNNSSPSLKNLMITNNSAYNSGGGIYCGDNSSPCLQNVTVTDNMANNGGGIYCSNSSPILKNVTITDNYSNTWAGGFYCGDNSAPIFENVTVTDNETDYYGGGICFNCSSPSLKNVTITGNISGYWGGGIICLDSTPILENITIANNDTNIYGGGIYLSGSSPILKNVTITDNYADHAGGIFCGYSSHPSLMNCILWNDTPQEIYLSEYGDSCSLIISYSDIQGGEIAIVTNNNGTVYWFDGNIDNDPLFVDPLNGDYHLTEFSPCIDAGDPNSPLDPDGTIADMGAYYYDHSNFDLTFNSLADMNTARLGFGYTTDGTSLYAVCGGTYEPPFYQVNNIEKYDPNIDNWEIFVDGLIPRRYCKAEYLQSTNSIYIFGGQTYYQTNPYTYTDTIEVVDVANVSVSYLPSNPILTEYAGSAVWYNKIYIFGGSENGVYSNSFYEFDPMNNIWIQLPYMPEAKQTEGEIVDGILYVFGGFNGSVSNRIDAYDIQNNEWSFIGYMPTGISAHHTTISGQYIWLIGDYENLDFVAVFNTETYEFNQLNTNMTGRRHCGTDVIGNFLYVYGGNIATGGPALSSLQYADISYLSIDDEPSGIPSSITLFQNYPNPFNPETTISFSIKQNSKIELEIFNIKGQLVKSLINEQQNAGNHSVIWNGKDMNEESICSGIYFYKLNVNGRTKAVKKCLLLK